MKTSSLVGLLLGGLFLLPAKNSTPKKKKPHPPGKKQPAQPVDFEGVLLGDSQSVGASSPGGRLAGLFTRAGRPCRVLAKGGKTAAWFLSGAGKLALDVLLKKKPKWVVVFLGSNELANIAAFPNKEGQISPKAVYRQVRPHEKLKALLSAAGVETFFVGPPLFGPKVKSESGGLPLNDAGPEWFPHMEAIYGASHTIDARPFTPEHEGVHFFSPKGCAEQFAENLAPVVLALLPSKVTP